MASTSALVSEINEEGIALTAFVSGRVFETDAWTFLQYAKEDLNESSTRGNVNALSNAKRAIGNRVDTLLHVYCLSHHARRERWNYPKKAEKLREAGVIVPPALQNMITSPRNDLEHDYKLPQNVKEVSNCVDVADMFIRLNDPIIGRGFLRWVIGPRGIDAEQAISSARVNQIPEHAFGMLIDREMGLFKVILNGETSEVSFAKIDSSDIAESLRIIYASIVPEETIILGPMPDSSFVNWYL